MSAFALCRNLLTFAIPTGVEEIGDYAFARSGVVTVTIPSGVKKIGMNAFCGCNRLESVCLPKSIETIGEGAFIECESLITIYAFEGCAFNTRNFYDRRKVNVFFSYVNNA